MVKSGSTFLCCGLIDCHLDGNIGLMEGLSPCPTPVELGLFVCLQRVSF